MGVAPRERAATLCRLSGCLCCESGKTIALADAAGGVNLAWVLGWRASVIQCGLGYEAVDSCGIATYLWAEDFWATGWEGGEGAA